MASTVRLFDKNSHLYEFDAVVLSCESIDTERYAVILDRTAFFPEGGGQYADVGTIDGLPVLDVQEKEGGVIHHLLPSPLSVGTTVTGILDSDIRFRRMQNHTGEHILSGLIFKAYGFHNVGFHLGHGDVTMDVGGVLDRAQLDAIEVEANRAVAKCLPVSAFYPTSEELSALEYRSKEPLLHDTESRGIRIVDIPGYDRCACCAPHVGNTGEIGIIKILDCIHYKGGMRLHIRCGFDALEDYRFRYTAIREMATSLSIKQCEIVEGLDKVLDDLSTARRTVSELRQKLWQQTLDTLPEHNRYLCLFEESADMAASARKIVTQAAARCDLWCALFIGNDTDGYRYTVGKGVSMPDVKVIAPAMNHALNGRGGGSADMIQGQVSASRADIQAYFKAISQAYEA